MFKIILSLIISALLGIGLTFPGYVADQTTPDSSQIMVNDDAIQIDTATKNLTEFELPRIDEEPLPPPADDDEPLLADLGP